MLFPFPAKAAICEVIEYVMLAGFLRLRVILIYAAVFLSGSVALGFLWKGVLS